LARQHSEPIGFKPGNLGVQVAHQREKTGDHSRLGDNS